MNCGNCGTPLNPGSNICPKCGAVNTLPGAQAAVAPVADSAPVVANTQAPVQNEIIDTKASLNTGEVSQVVQDVIPVINGVEQTNNVIDAGASEVISTQVDASIAPPTLEVAKENLRTSASDWASASTNASDYGQEDKNEEVVIPQEKSGATAIASTNVQIEIPAAQDSQPGTLTTGIEEISADGSTVGEKTSEEETKKFKFGKKEIKLKGGSAVSNKKLIIWVVVALCIGMFIGKYAFSKTISIASRCETSDISTVADGKNNVTEIGGIKYQIPEKYSYDKDNKGLMVYDKDGLFRLYIRYCDGSYDDVANAKESIKATLTNQEIAVSDIKEITVLEKYSYVVISTTKNLTNRLVAITSGKKEGKLFYVEIVTTDNKIDLDALDLAADIINNAKEVEVSDIEALEVNDIFDLVSSTSTAHIDQIGK